MVGGLLLVGVLAVPLAVASGASRDRGASALAPIKVMLPLDITAGAPLPSEAGGVPYAQAAVAAANAQGGINGHKIDLIVCDTMANPNDTIACARQAVSDHVAAVVGDIVFFDAQFQSVIGPAHIPWVTGAFVSPQANNSPTSYCISNYSTYASGIPQMVKQLGGKKLSLITPSGTGVAPTVEAALKVGSKASGLPLGAFVTPPETVTDYSPSITQAFSGGADSVFMDLIGSFTGVAAQAKQYDPKAIVVLPFTITGFGGDTGYPARLAVLSPVEPVSNTKVPGISLMRQELQKYAPSSVPSEWYMLNVWMPYDMFVRAARGIKGAVTPASVIQRFNTLGNFSMRGITPNYDSAKRGIVPGYKCVTQTGAVVTQTSSTGLKVVGSGKFLTYPAG